MREKRKDPVSLIARARDRRAYVCETIAQDVLGVETLCPRRRRVHKLDAAQLRTALTAAYRAGRGQTWKEAD